MACQSVKYIDFDALGVDLLQRPQWQWHLRGAIASVGLTSMNGLQIHDRQSAEPPDTTWAVCQV